MTVFEEALAIARQAYRNRDWARAMQMGQGAIAHLRQHPGTVSPMEAAEAWLLVGLLSQQTGNLDAAITAYQEAIALCPTEAKLYNNLGTALKAKGAYAAATEAYQQALFHQPHYPEVYLNLGNLAQQQGESQTAIAHYQSALRQHPYYADALHNLGWVYQQQGQFQEAIAHYRQAIAQSPNNPEFHNAMGNVLQRLQQFEAALPHYQEAIALRPDDPAFYSNLGAAYQELGRLPESAQYYRRAIALNPHYADAYYNLGNNYKAQDRLRDSVRVYQRAIALRPQYPQALNNLGLVLYELGHLKEAIATYTQAIALRNDYPDAHLNRGLARLQQGEFQGGFADYEWRWQVTGINFKPPREFPQPQWDGSPLAGQTILLHAEQGLGDTLQFIRYVPLVVARGGRVVVECQAPLVNLLTQMPQVHQVVARGETLPEFQVHAPLMSLPHLFGTTLETIPNSIPYLTVSRSLPLPGLEKSDRRIRVGVVWSGSSGNLNDRLRSCGLAALLPLFDLPGVQFYALQKEVRPEDKALLQQLVSQGKLWDVSALLTDFCDTAAIAQQLDVIISVDTSVAHLAGALGRPVWLLLTDAPDWRWLQYRDDSPWYPTARLFRQTQRNEWGPVVQRVRLLLSAIVRSHDQQPIPLTEQQRATEWMAQANQCRSSDRPRAIHLYQQALALNPYDYRIYNNLGVALRQQGEISAAIAAYACAITLHPSFADAHYNLGNLWRERREFTRSIYHYRQAIAHQPNANTWNNLGNSLKELGDVSAAIAAYEEAIALQPDHASAHHNLGYAKLLLGDLKTGFAEYEWRWRVANFAAPRPWAVPQWDGSDLNGATILLHGEQGLGDAIQFCRYVPLVAERGGRVVVEGRSPLLRLLATVPGVTAVVDRDRPKSEVQPDLQPEVHAPLMSLPHLFGTTLDTIPATVPYLYPPEPAQPLPGVGDRPKIGLVWAGSPTHLNDAQRSLHLVQLMDLLSLPIDLYSLQKGAAAEQRHNLPESVTLHDLGDRLQDFADTASILTQLDLVVTVDTAIAHLAGALGRPVWVLLPAAPDWRWMLDREDSPWYPTMRLFRQPSLGNWDSAIAHLVQALKTEFGLGGPTPTPKGQPVAEGTVRPRPAPLPAESSIPATAIGIGWQLSPATGWGIYGINLALQLIKGGHPPFPLLPPSATPATPFNPLHWALLRPAFAQQQRWAAVQNKSDQQPFLTQGRSLPCVVLKGLGNQCIAAPTLEGVTGRATVGVIFFEESHWSTAALERAKSYDRLITGSTWNEQVLRAHGINQVATVFQGIDPTIFHPAPAGRWWGDRFIIFSGGKLEYRKGQDIVIEVFRQFRDRHPDALLLTAWHNAWPATLAGLETAGYVTHPPSIDAQGKLPILPWLETQGIPPASVIDVGAIPNHLVGAILREATVALFPNRAEGGTNLAAMESLACGVPTILSANTGHLDLIQPRHATDPPHCYALHQQTIVRPTSLNRYVDGWGESEVEEILQVLEQVYSDRPTAQQVGQAGAHFMAQWSWEQQVQQLLAQLPESP